MPNPNQLLEILWAEDVNLAASAAVALALAAGRRGPWTPSTVDLAFGPDKSGCSIRALHTANETGSAGGGTFTVAENPRSPYEVGPINAIELTPEHLYFTGKGIPIPNRATLGYNGSINAAAAEAICAAWIDVPKYDNGFDFQAPKAWDEIILVAPTSAARVANTQSGHTDICGRAVAYTGGQLPIPNDPGITIQVIHVQSNDVAGYAGPGLESPGGKGNLSFPCIPATPEEYDMMEIFGALPPCKASEPFNMFGCGAVGVAPLTLSTLTLGLSGV